MDLILWRAWGRNHLDTAGFLVVSGSPSKSGKLSDSRYPPCLDGHTTMPAVVGVRFDDVAAPPTCDVLRWQMEVLRGFCWWDANLLVMDHFTAVWMGWILHTLCNCNDSEKPQTSQIWMNMMEKRNWVKLTKPYRG